MEDRATFIDAYEIKEMALSTAEGIIYRAFEKSSGVSVLLKKYYPSLDWSEEALNEFFNLFSYLRFIEHDCLLPVLDVGKNDGKPYVVFADPGLSLLCGRKLEAASQAAPLEFLSSLAEGLDFLHKQEIVHGSLRPENIAVDPDGYPLLFDFGLSGVFKKLLLENIDEGFENVSIASVNFTSPEQIQGRSPGRASDLYAFGLIGYYYISGELPFHGKYIPEAAAAHLSNTILPIPALPADISRQLLELLQKCIQVKPEARFEGFAPVLQGLERLKSGRRARWRSARRFSLVEPVPDRRVALSWAGGIALGLSVLLLSYLYIRNAGASALPAPTSPESAPATALAPTRTRTPYTETPAQTSSSNPDPSPSPVSNETAYHLAFENEQPVVLQQPISTENLADLREISRLGYGKPEEAAVTPDNNYVAVATSAGVILFRGDQLFQWIDPQGWATSVQFSPDGALLAIGLKTGEIQLWDWQNKTLTTRLSGHTNKINRIIFSRSGLLYSASADKHIIVWNVISGKSIKDINAHSKAVNDIAVTSDARILVSCSDDRLIRVWDLASAQKLYELDSHYFTGIIKAIAITSDDAYFAAGGEAGYLYQWNLVTSELSATASLQLRNDILPVQEKIWSLQYIRDDRELLLGIDKGKSLTYEAGRRTYAGLSSSFEIELPSVKDVDVFGSSFAFDSFSAFDGEGVLSLNWDGQVTRQETQLVSPMYDVLDRLDFSPDGTILAAGGQRGSTHIWNLSTNALLYENLYFLPFGDPIAPDGNSVALIVPNPITTSAGNVVNDEIYQIKNLTGSQSTRDLAQVIPGARVGYTSDGNILIASSLTKSRAWEYANGNEAYLKGYAYTGCWITASANNLQDRLQVNSAAGLFPPVDTDDEHIDSLCPKTHQFRGSLSAFSRDLSLLAYINRNGALEGYDVLKKAPAWAPYQIKGPRQVTTLAVSPDGSVIAVGDAAGNILFISGKTGEPLRELAGNFGSLRAIAFSEDGKKIATAGEDGLVRLFGISEAR